MRMGKREILTVPNLLSLLRLCMIPLIAVLYLTGRPVAAAVVLILSGFTDLLDGWYARRFNAVSDLGKVLDPIADKLTQAAMLLCLVSVHRQMLLPFVLLIIKEIFASLSGLTVIRRTGVVPAAVWHGKVTTALLYLTMIIHAAWQELPDWTSNILIAGCTLMMCLSMVLYGVRNVRLIKNATQGG